jgi:hypothetical protein
MSVLRLAAETLLVGVANRVFQEENAEMCGFRTTLSP